MVYIALKAKREDLLGSTLEERSYMAQVKEVLMDIKKDFFGLVGNKAVLDLQKEFNKKVLQD